MIIGINATKDAIFVAETRNADGQFLVSRVLRVQFEIQQAGDLSDLLQNISTILNRDAGSTVSSVAILRCSGGQFGASVEAIKAEAIVELSAHQKGLPISMVAPQSLKKALVCGSGEKWQDKSKLMFNSDGQHKYWSQGANGAVCAAYKLSKG
jgi:Holliday junction resolvasome RuvABC endonuclease subunit